MKDWVTFLVGNVTFDVKFLNLESMTKKDYQQFCQMKRHNFWEEWMPIKKKGHQKFLRNSFFLYSLKDLKQGGNASMSQRGWTLLHVGLFSSCFRFMLSSVNNKALIN